MPQLESIRFQPSRPLLKEVTADKLNSIVSQIRRNRPRGERGITVRQAGDATYIGLAKNFAEQTTTKPWDIYVETTSGGEDESVEYSLKVIPGTINNILASNWDNVFANIDDTSIYYGVANITTDGKNITSVEIDINDTAPEQQTPLKFAVPQNVSCLFGIFYRGASYNILQESVYLYGRVTIVTTPDPPAQPGESPFEIWYDLGKV